MKTSEVIRGLCKTNGISVTELESELGFGNGSLTKGNFIRSDRLLSIAKRFNVSMEYLMGEQEPKLSHLINDFEYMIICEYRKAPIHKQEAILDILHISMEVSREKIKEA